MNSGLSLGIYGVDCCFSKTMLWDGNYHEGVSRTGFGQNIPILFAAIPVEDTSNLSWVTCLAISSGLPLEDVKIPTDKGEFMSTANVLSKELGISLNLETCIEHHLRNLTRLFGLKKKDPQVQELRNIVHYVYYSPTMESCTRHLYSVPDKFGFNHGFTLMASLALVEPRHYMVAANIPGPSWDDASFLEVRKKALMEAIYWTSPERTDEEIANLEKYVSDNGRRPTLDFDQSLHQEANDMIERTKVNPKGKRLPLFGVSRSNLVESEMSAALANGIRHSTPPRAFQIWINRVQEKYSEFCSAITQASIDYSCVS